MEQEINVEKNNEQLMLARQALMRATKNPKLSKYINEEMVEEALSKVHICSSFEEFANRVKDVCKEEGIEFSNEYLNNTDAVIDVKTGDINVLNVEIETIVHEAVHHMSKKNGENGIIEIAKQLAKDDSNWEGMKENHIELLNEAITQYITKIILEGKMDKKTTYDYGLDVLESYEKATNGYEKENNNILTAYFNKDKESLAYIAKDFNRGGILKWNKMLESFFMYHVGVNEANLSLLKKCIKRKDIDAHLENVSERYKTYKHKDFEHPVDEEPDIREKLNMDTSKKVKESGGVVTEEKYEEIYGGQPHMTKAQAFAAIKAKIEARKREEGKYK